MAEWVRGCLGMTKMSGNQTEVVVTQRCVYTKTHWTVHLNVVVPFMSCEFYFNTCRHVHTHTASEKGQCGTECHLPLNPLSVSLEH